MYYVCTTSTNTPWFDTYWGCMGNKLSSELIYRQVG